MPKQKVRKFDVITIGGATQDIMFYSGDGDLIKTGNLTKQKLLAFEYGAKIMADKLFFSFGGGSANTAVSFSKLGLKSAIVCRVGTDQNGRQVIDNLKSNKVSTNFIKAKRNEVTGFSMILTVDNTNKEHILFTYRGANDRLSAADLPTALSDAGWLYVSSLPEIGWQKIMKKVVDQPCNIVWNPGSRQLVKLSSVKRFLPKVKLLILNRDEALEFKKLKNIKSLIKHIKDLGPEIVVVTDGEKGAYAYDGKKYYFMKARSSKNVDTVGVGDAFSSAFTSALIYGKNIKSALSWGIKNSASVVEKIGAQNGLLSHRKLK